MADRPILFGAPMVRALLEGRKSQTRRALKPQPVGIKAAKRSTFADGGACWLLTPESNRCSVDFTGPRFAPGDRLWVKETWRTNAMWDRLAPSQLAEESRQFGRVSVLFEAGGALSGSVDAAEAGRIRSSIHMPRWASRLTLLVTDVRVQRLQAISEADAKAEGLEWVAPTYGIGGIAASWNSDPRESYAALWNSINGPGAWEANPWVVAVSFDVRKGNIDA